MRAATPPDVCGVGIEDRFVVRLSVLGKCFDHVWIGFVSVGLQGIHNHAKSAVRHDGPLERRLGLKTDDDFILAIDVARAMRGDGTWNLGDVEHAFLALFHKEFVQTIPQIPWSARLRAQERTRLPRMARSSAG